MTVEDFLTGLHAVRRSSRGYMARCPAHSDKSLRVCGPTSFWRGEGYFVRPVATLSSATDLEFMPVVDGGHSYPGPSRPRFMITAVWMASFFCSRNTCPPGAEPAPPELT